MIRVLHTEPQFGGSAVGGISKIRWFMLALLTLAVPGLVSTRVSAQGIVHWSQNIPGDSKAIILNADEISTWMENTHRVFLLKGTVLVEHGVVHARMQGGVAWADLQRLKETGILHVDLYAEGDVFLENGPQSQGCPQAMLDLNTRGQLKLNAFSKVLQLPRSEDPLYQRGRQEWIKQNSGPTGPGVQKTGGQEPVPGPPGTAPSSSGPSGPPAPSPGTVRGLSPAAGLADPPENTSGVNPVFPEPAPGLFGPASGSASSPPGTSSFAPGTPALPGGAAPPPAASTSGYPPDLPSSTPPAAGGPLSSNAPPGTSPEVSSAPPPSGFETPLPPMVTPPIPPVPPPNPPPASAPGPPLAAAPRPERHISIVPRTSAGLNARSFPMPNGETAWVVTSGVIITVRGLSGIALLDIEADRMVMWRRQGFPGFTGPNASQGQTTQEGEFYLAGNVEIREQNGPQSRKITADEVYYDVGRNVAIAYRADLEFKQPGLPDPVHLRAERLEELSPTQFAVIRAETFSSHLPSDPGLKVYVREGTLEEKAIPKRSLFGVTVFNRLTGQPEIEHQDIFHGSNVFFEAEDVPFFYLPFIQGDARDPLGPLRTVMLDYNRVFGFRAGLTFNLYDLIGLDPIPGTKWDLDVDYLSNRGPALGSEYDYAGNSLFGIPGKYSGVAKVYGIYDTGTDILGGGRGGDNHPNDRGRLLWRQTWELPLDFTLQFQLADTSDKNFLEQYYPIDYMTDINQDSFAYLKQQRNNWAWTILAEDRMRSWVTDTNWLPRVDGYLLGQTIDEPFLDRFTYNVRANAAYAQLEVQNQLTSNGYPAPPVSPTDVTDSTGRFDLWQELSLPFYLGPVKLVPYAISDLAYYTNDLQGQDQGRTYEAGGLRASVPFTRLYPDVSSDLLNL
ncbi:MAG: hypothetical protein JO112_00355, partial [Planctomycetes bacterium]|nr:hypothetical protein [Planctomycetota bacterium]